VEKDESRAVGCKCLSKEVLMKYYQLCPEFDGCNQIMEPYWGKKEYGKVCAVHLPLAEKGYPLAEG